MSFPIFHHIMCSIQIETKTCGIKNENLGLMSYFYNPGKYQFQILTGCFFAI